MVCTGQPKGAIALHTLEPDYGVLQGFVHGVTHMELTRDIGGRHHYRKGNFVVVAHGFETAVFFPFLIEPFFKIFGVIGFFHVNSPDRYFPYARKKQYSK